MLISIGSALYAGAIRLFIIPNALVTGGFSGLAILLNALTGIPPGALIFALNIPVFIAGFRFIGRPFTFKSCFATALVSLFTDLFGAFFEGFVCEKMLACVAGGLLGGFGLSLVIMRGGSTGGADIIAKLIRRKFSHLPIGKIILVFDCLVIGLHTLFFRRAENALYSLLMIILNAAALDYFVYGSENGKILFVFTDKAAAMAQRINRNGHRGATIVPAVGAFTKEERAMLIIALKNHEITAMYHFVREVDANAFITLLEARTIIGKGFKETYE